MKIICIIKSLALTAGLERVITDKINWLADQGYEVTLLTYEQGLHPLSFPLHPNVYICDLDTPFFRLGAFSLFRRFFKYLNLKSVFGKRLKSIVESIHPDLVITTTYSLKVLDEIVTVCKPSRLIIESHESCFSVIKEYDYQSNPFLRIIAKLYDLHYYRNINKFDRLVSLTEGDANEWRKHISSDIEIIPNPLTYYPLTLGDESVDRPLRIISAGRLEEVKGFDMLIDAFSLISDKCPEWRVDIFGQGSCENKLRMQIIYKGLEDRIFINPPTAKIFEEYCQSDIYVLSSRHEGMGMALIEAMSCNIPCIAFDCKYGPAEIISDKETGLLVEDGNVRELAKTMLWLIDHKEERQRIGNAARESVKKFRKDIIMQKWVELFERLCI